MRGCGARRVGGLHAESTALGAWGCSAARTHHAVLRRAGMGHVACQNRPAPAAGAGCAADASWYASSVVRALA